MFLASKWPLPREDHYTADSVLWFLKDEDFDGIPAQFIGPIKILMAQLSEKSYRRGFYQGAHMVANNETIFGVSVKNWDKCQNLLIDWRYSVPICVTIAPGIAQLADVTTLSTYHGGWYVSPCFHGLSETTDLERLYEKKAGRHLHNAVQQFYKPRKPLSKKRRFEVLKRFHFRCHYCGARGADGVELHVDHVHPVSKGGMDCDDNLVAACRDCNLGKGTREI